MRRPNSDLETIESIPYTSSSHGDKDCEFDGHDLPFKFPKPKIMRKLEKVTNRKGERRWPTPEKPTPAGNDDEKRNGYLLY